MQLDNSHGGTIKVGNGETVDVKGIGSGKLKFLDEKDCARTAIANDVLYAPDMVGNMLSVKRLVESNYTIEFNERFCEIKHCGKQIGVADPVGNLYRLRQNCVNAAIEVHKDNCIHDWHRKLGHQDPEAIKKMHANSLVDEFILIVCGLEISGDTCNIAKMSHILFPKNSLSVSDEPLDLTHKDACGSMQTQTHGGKRYMVNFIDVFSRFTFVRLLTHKSEVSCELKNFIELLKNNLDKRPKIISSDRDGEYIDNRVKQYLNINVSSDNDGNYELCQSNYIHQVASIGTKDIKSKSRGLESVKACNCVKEEEC